MPRVTPEHLDARRRQILTAAHRCFARHSPHVTTMQEIAEEAGLSAGALYRYFDGKEALIEALAGWGREIKEETLKGLEPGGGTEALARVVGEMVRPLEAGSPAIEATLRLDVRLWGEALDQPRIRRLFREQMAAIKDPIASYLRVEREAGRIRRDADPEAIADVVFALMAGLELQKAFDPALDVGRYLESLRRLIRSFGTAADG